MKILSVIGTRPEALKMGPVIQALTGTRGVQSLVCLTGQHRELIREPLALFSLKADFNLRLMRPQQTPDALLVSLLEKLRPVIQRAQPDWIMAVGDTTSVLGASLAAAHQQVRFAHVEAGLRSHNQWNPYPEEFNRRIATVLADLHLAPTTEARQNLRQENIPSGQIIVTGNPIIDTLRQCLHRPEPANLRPLWRQLGQENVVKGPIPRLIVATFHRRENIGRPIRQICAALRDLARHYRGTVKILCILHPNPAVCEPAQRDLQGEPHIILTRPLGYRALLAVLQRTTLLMTDSGGLQEEAPWLGVRTLVLRNCTERPEAMAAGATRLVGTERNAIVTAAHEELARLSNSQRTTQTFSGYGDGNAAQRIVAALKKHHA